MVNQTHLISKQDFSNIKHEVIDSSIRRHEDGTTSVHLIVSELHMKPYDPVLVYKPQNSNTPDFLKLPDDIFILAIQTAWQKEVYLKYASSIVCIDLTHGTNTYQFKVITCIVPDEFGKGEG